MRSRSAKNKGVRLQNWTRDLLLKLAPSLKKDDIRCAIMGERDEDIKLSPAAREIYRISVECKNVEKLNVWNAYEQALDNCPLDCEPVVVFKKNHKTPKVMVDAEFFFKVLSK